MLTGSPQWQFPIIDVGVHLENKWLPDVLRQKSFPDTQSNKYHQLQNSCEKFFFIPYIGRQVPTL